jgi:hypothetical protein
MFQRFLAEGTDAGLDFEVEVEPEKRVYCFFGRNGAGKTSLLENLGRTLLLSHEMLDGGWKAKPSPFAGVYRRADIEPALRRLEFRPPNQARLDQEDLRTSRTQRHSVDLGLWAKQLLEKSFVDRPVVAISARDRGFTGNLAVDRVKLLGSRSSRFVQSYLRTYQALTRQPVETESLAEWLAARLIVNPAFARTDDRSFEVETMLKLMEDLDPVLFAGLSRKAPDGSLAAIHYSDGRLWLGQTPLDKLPSGFVAVMKLFQEILGGFAGWTAFEDVQDLGAVNGVVLIDEIDAHLHPTWQAKILPLLKRFFPRATFYVCTHSPLIVATTEEGEAYELVRDGQRVTARRLGNPRTWYLADVYEQAFHVEMPVTGEEMKIPDLLLDFSIKVKDHLRTRDAALAEQAKALYERLVPSIPPTDPRRASLDALRKMVA